MNKSKSGSQCHLTMTFDLERKKSYNRGQIASAEVTLYLLLHAISYHFCKVKKAYDKCL